MLEYCTELSTLTLLGHDAAHWVGHPAGIGYWHLEFSARLLTMVGAYALMHDAGWIREVRYYEGLAHAFGIPVDPLAYRVGDCPEYNTVARAVEAYLEEPWVGVSSVQFALRRDEAPVLIRELPALTGKHLWNEITLHLRECYQGGNITFSVDPQLLCLYGHLN